MFKTHLQNISREDFQNAIAKLNFSSQNAERSVQTTLTRADKYPFLDEIVTTLQQVGKTDGVGANSVERLIGMKILAEALILIAEQAN